MNRSHPRYVTNGLICGLWALALIATLTWPWFSQSPLLGDDLTRHTVRLSLLFYVSALTLLLLRRGATPTDTARIRLLWTLAWATYLVHLAMAFHYYHGWSHEHAIEHVRQRSGWGNGIYVSHLFTIVWTADVALWWLSSQGYASRPAWITRLLHAFMLFITFNATVVYEAGFIRWAGIGIFVWLGCCLALRTRGDSAFASRSST
jgi:hypothetical protein